MGARCEAKSKHARVRVTERWNGAAPILPIDVGPAADVRNAGAMLTQTLASAAGHNARIQIVEFRARGRHNVILLDWDRSFVRTPNTNVCTCSLKSSILDRGNLVRHGEAPLAIIEGVFVGSPKTLRDERGEWVSSIVRKRIDGPVGLWSEGFDGDKVTQPYHGGPEAAACVHLADHYDFWRDHYGIDLNHGHLGENIILIGMKEEEIYVGDIVRIGSALVQVSGPRVPCETQARRVGRADWVRLTIRENRTGFYVRVLEAGAVQNQDGWLLLERLNERGSI